MMCNSLWTLKERGQIRREVWGLAPLSPIASEMITGRRSGTQWSDPGSSHKFVKSQRGKRIGTGSFSAHEIEPVEVGVVEFLVQHDIKLGDRLRARPVLGLRHEDVIGGNGAVELDAQPLVVAAR